MLSRGVLEILTAVALAAAGAALILGTGRPAHPVWLAFQRSDLTVASVAVGVYWRIRRPHSRFGPMLVATGYLSAVLPLQAASSPFLHTLGALCEIVAVFWTFCLVLAFPSGRVGDPTSRIAIVVIGLAYAAWAVPLALLAPRLEGSVLTGCLRVCPHNPLMVASAPHFLAAWTRAIGCVFVVGVGLAGIALGRRLFALRRVRLGGVVPGTIAGLVFVAANCAYTVALIVSPNWQAEVDGVVPWTIVGSRALLPWGFLVALVAAEIAAAQVLRRLVEVSLGSRSLGELEVALSDALGDRDLRLGLWRRRDRVYVDADGRPLPRTPVDSRQTVTEARDEEGRGLAILHADLRGEPELAEAAVAGALLALDNARLESDLDDTVAELGRSRARLVAASNAERRRIERDLHDGAQQQLVALRIKVGLMLEGVTADAALEARIAELATGLEQALEELRELAHGIYPPILAGEGLRAALEAVAFRSDHRVTVDAAVGRYPPEIEAAVYYVCLEALQNAAKHGGPEASPTVSVAEHDDRLTFVVADRGYGFDVAASRRGDGIRNMEDRIGAVGGQLEIGSAPGTGTVVSGTVPLCDVHAVHTNAGVSSAFGVIVGEP